MKSVFACVICAVAIAAMPAAGQVELKGRLWAPRLPGASELIPETAIRGFATVDGRGAQAMGTRTFEMEPAGWSYMSGPAGRYTMLYSTPAKRMRPIVLTNVFTKPGDVVDFPLIASYTLGIFEDKAWDTKAATGYYQTFVADGKCVTSVGFRMVHDGIDGEGPASQSVLVSIHRKTSGTPDRWPRVGPAMVALNVDCGGPKDYSYSVGWNSGEVPTTPGQTYAVFVRPEKAGNVFQTYWTSEDHPGGQLYRTSREGSGWQDHDMWIAVASDSDGLVIPYNKRVHMEYGNFGGFSTRWSQTYVAQGRSLAGVILYAAQSGVQPSMNRQRVRVRVRKGGPTGPEVGIQKVAIGNATYTGDASWGTFGTAYSPGEVPLIPGETYTLEFETIENYETLHGYLNFKGQFNDDRPGFNPYVKVTPDDYPKGVAYKNGQKTATDLDMQVIEYAANPADWDMAVEQANLLKNGGMDQGRVSAAADDSGAPTAWEAFAIDPETRQFHVADPNNTKNRILRVLAGGSLGKNPWGGDGRTADGGFVQKVDGLKHDHTYRITGQTRSSWPVDMAHQVYVGYDPTGQTEDSSASTIVWDVQRSLSGYWLSYTSDPIRPAEDSISVWLRGVTTRRDDYPFKADFDNFTLKQVKRGVPKGK